MGSKPQGIQADMLDSSRPEAYLNLLHIAWRRKSLVCFGLAGAVVLGLLYYAQRPPVYRSAAQVLVVKKRPETVPLPGIDPRVEYFEDYLSTHQVLIRSPLIVKRAVNKHSLHWLKSFPKEDPTSDIIRSLTVTRDKSAGSGNGNIINLSFRAGAADDCPQILNAVILSYQDFLNDTYRNVNNETLKLITEAKDVVKKQLDEKESAYGVFLEKGPIIWRGKDGSNLRPEELAGIESKKAALLVRRAEIEGEIESIEGALKNGSDQVTLADVISDLSAKAGVPRSQRSQPATLDEQLLPLLQQEQRLLQDFGPAHPEVQSVHKRIELTRDFMAHRFTARTGAESGPGGEESGGVEEPVRRYVRVLKQELDGIKMSEQLLTAALEREQKEARKLINYEIRDKTFQRDITRTQQLYDSIIKRLAEVDFVKDFGGYDAQIISPADSAPRIEPNALVIFPIAAFLGLGCGFVLAFLAELTDKSFRNPEEIRQQLGVPLLGHIPVITVSQTALEKVGSNGSALDPILCSVYRPKSNEAEAYRGVRTALYFSTCGEGHKVVQITSPILGDGKTTLAANLSISIAQSGQRVLLIDADLRKPRLRKLFGLAADVGLTSVLAGAAELKAAIQEIEVPGLSVLPCGPLPPNPAELLSSPRFKELLECVRDQYDFVVVDTPPLLVVTDPCVVAARVDGVLLTLRLTKNGRPQAERAKQILGTLQVKLFGVVVNGVEATTSYGGYGYEHYGYYSHEYTEKEPNEPEDGGVATERFEDRPEGRASAARTKLSERPVPAHSPQRPRQGLLSWLRKS